ncbi:Zinc finger, SWIM-type [Phytophthora cactorum]|nr:Zinc finger, SWIM-type [Phytophthora cactorum]
MTKVEFHRVAWLGIGRNGVLGLIDKQHKAHLCRASAFHVERPHDSLLSDRQTGQRQEAPLQGETSVHSDVVLGVEGEPIQHQAKLRRHLGSDTAHMTAPHFLPAGFQVFTEVQRQVAHDTHRIQPNRVRLPCWIHGTSVLVAAGAAAPMTVGVVGLDVLREVAPAGARCLLPNERAATAVVADDDLVLVVQDRLEVEEGEALPKGRYRVVTRHWLFRGDEHRFGDDYALGRLSYGGPVQFCGGPWKLGSVYIHGQRNVGDSSQRASRYQLQKDSWMCDCEFAITMKLPCRHSMLLKKFIRSAFTMPLLAIPARWFGQSQSSVDDIAELATHL